MPSPGSGDWSRVKSKNGRTKKIGLNNSLPVGTLDPVAARLAILDRIHASLETRCRELGGMNASLVTAVDGWRRLCDGQLRELKALRLVAFIADDPKTALGQLRAELAEARTACAQAEQMNGMLEESIAQLKKDHAEQLQALSDRIQAMDKRRRKKGSAVTVPIPPMATHDWISGVATPFPPRPAPVGREKETADPAREKETAEAKKTWPVS